MDSLQFEPLFTQILRLFSLMYSAGVKLFDFFSTPMIDSIFAETILEDVAGFLDTFVPLLSLTPFELMFGAGLISVLLVGVVKYFMFGS